MDTLGALFLRFSSTPLALLSSPLALVRHLQALADTVLVLAVVVASGFVLFGSNVALTNMSEWWYSN